MSPRKPPAEALSDKPAPRGGVQSIERAASLLDAVAGAPDGIGLVEVSAQVGLHTSTAFHLIRTLVGLGFLVQDGESKRYRIGSRLFTLAAGALDESALLTLGMPVLERLSADTGEAAHLAVRTDQSVTLIARTAASGMLQMSERAGVRRPLHATAIGKVVAAALPAPDLDRLLSEIDLPALTAHTITDPARLRAELDQVRRTGIAHDRCELDPDVRCVAVPVNDFAGRCVASMGISGPIWRLADEAVLIRHQTRLQEAAQELSAMLGHRKGPAQQAG